MGHNLRVCVMEVAVGLAAVCALAEQPTTEGDAALFPELRLGSGFLVPARWCAGCGPDSLYLALRLIGVDCDYVDLPKRMGISKHKQRVNMNDLWQAAQEVGAHGAAVVMICIR